VLQVNDGVKDAVGGGRGVTSTALWDSLKTSCLQMQRTDLASLCDARDLEREFLMISCRLRYGRTELWDGLVEFRVHFDERGL